MVYVIKMPLSYVLLHIYVYLKHICNILYFEKKNEPRFSFRPKVGILSVRYVVFPRESVGLYSNTFRDNYYR